MKKLIPLIILLAFTSLSLSAQNRKGKKKQRPAKTETQSTTTENNSTRSKVVNDGMSLNPRANRNIAITGESGFKTLSGFGLNATYYVQPKIAIDLGAGLGLQLVRAGIRGRYLFLDKNFTPYVGAGLYFNPIAIPDVIVSDLENDYLIDINSSTFGQFVVGAEFMANKGFVVGFNVGYSAAFNDVWTSDNMIPSATETVTKKKAPIFLD